MTNKLSLSEIIRATGAKYNLNTEIFFEGVSTDSRKIKKDELFVAIDGENFKGENFVNMALKNGSVALVNESSEKKFSNKVLRVKNTLTAYQQIAEIWRKRFKIPVIAITGSNGKTTTKDLIAAVLSVRGNVLKTQNNFNNEIGVPMTLLKLNENQKFAVIELGMRGLGQIKKLAEIVKPNIGIVTNVTETHIELLKTLENIAKAKSELITSIEDGGTVILNADNLYTLAMKKDISDGINVVTYAIESEADLKAKNIRMNGQKTNFIASYENENFKFEIPLVGRHNVSNALAAIAVGLTNELSFDEIQNGFSKFEPTKMRFEIIRCNGLTIINDAYNASPASMKAAIQNVSDIYDGRKIAVLGDMLELGNISEEAHREVGRLLVRNGFDTLITLGVLGRIIGVEAKLHGLKNVYSFESHNEIIKKLLEISCSGDTILLKASRGMHMEKILEFIQVAR